MPEELSESDRMIWYGPCERCGGPRDVQDFMIGVTVHRTLWCPNCAVVAGEVHDDG